MAQWTLGINPRKAGASTTQESVKTPPPPFISASKLPRKNQTPTSESVARQAKRKPKRPLRSLRLFVFPHASWDLPFREAMKLAEEAMKPGPWKLPQVQKDRKFCSK